MTTVATPQNQSSPFALPPSRFDLPRCYRTERDAHGRVRVPDVPIFGENKRGTSYGEVGYSLGWLRQALRRDIQHRSGGYTLPLHFGHHEQGLVRERAGEVELTHIALKFYEGKPTWILFGTLVFKDEQTFEKARRDYPYRSVEISHEKSDEVNSLALLSTEAPYFRFPNLTFRALSANGGRAFLWSQKFMADNLNSVPAPGAPVAEGSAPTPTVKAEADGMSDFARKMAERMDALEAMFAKAFSVKAEADMDASYEADEADESDGDEDEDDDKDGKGKKKDKKPAGHVPVVAASADLAELKGAFAAQSAKIAKLEREVTAEQEFKTIKAELAAYDLPNLDAELRKEIASGTAKAWAKGVKTHSPAKARSFASEAPRQPQDAPEVAKYGDSPERLAKARELQAMYASLKPSHFLRKHTLAAFISSQMAAAGQE